MNATLIIKKLYQNLRTEKKSMAVNLCILAVAFLSVTAVMTMLTNLSRVITSAQDHFQLTIYLKNGAGKEKISSLTRAIEQFPEVRKVKYVSNETFKTDFLSSHGFGKSDMQTLGKEIFPATLQVKLSPGFIEQPSAASMIKKLGKIDIVEDIGYHENWMKHFGGFLKFLWIGFLIFGIMILLSSLFVLSNMLQLSFSKRSRAIEVMKLCGATNSFIEVPVLLEGFLFGLTGSIISMLVTWGAVHFLRNEIASYLQGIFSFTIHFIPMPYVIVLVFLCAMTGMSGAYLASRKVLRM